MIRTQIQFDEKQYERIRGIARRERVSISAIVRRLVTRGIDLDDGDRGKEITSLLDLAAVGVSGVADLGRRHDDYLDESFDSKGEDA